MRNEQDDADELASRQDAHDCIREVAAREGFIKWRMTDLPQVYHTLMPYSCDAKELLEAEAAIRRQYREDQKLAMSPWLHLGPRPMVLDTANLSSHGLCTLGLEISVAMGMPAAVKLGCDANGRSWNDHPDVVRAFENAPRTAEWVAHEQARELELRARAASTAYVTATNAWADEHPHEMAADAERKPRHDDDASPWDTDPGIVKLKAAADQALQLARDARDKFDQLRFDRIAACQIVRELPADKPLTVADIDRAIAPDRRREKLL